MRINDRRRCKGRRDILLSLVGLVPVVYFFSIEQVWLGMGFHVRGG